MASKRDISLIKQGTKDEAEEDASSHDEPQEAKRRKKEASDQLPPKYAPVKVEDDAFDKQTDDESESLEEKKYVPVKPVKEEDDDAFDKETDDESESLKEKAFSDNLAKWIERVKNRVKKYEQAGSGRALAMSILSKEGFDYHMKDDEGEALNMFMYEPYGNGQGLELSETEGSGSGIFDDCRAKAILLLDLDDPFGGKQNDSEEIKDTANRNLYLIPGSAKTWDEWSNGDWDMLVKEAESHIGPFPGPFTISRLTAIIKELEGIVFEEKKKK